MNEWTEKVAVPAEAPAAPAAPPPATQPLSQPDAFTAPVTLPTQLVSAAAAVRGALKKAARERTSTSWSRLEHQLGSALPSLNNSERVQVLVQVDRSAADNQPRR